MTRCLNCNEGYVEDTAVGYLNENVWLPEWVICSCCGGDYENCRNCEKEFPNSIEAVQVGND